MSTPARLFAANVFYPALADMLLKESIFFFRQFATLLHAGLPLYQALTTLEGQAGNARFRAVLCDCRAQVEAGGRISEVFARYPWLFSELQIEMIRAAEQGGLLDEMLQRIADYLEQELRLRRFLSQQTLYSKIIVVVGLFIVPVIFGFLFGGAPWYAVKDSLFALIWAGLIIGAVFALCRTFLFQSEEAREGYERIKWALPGVGKVARKYALAKFGRAFAALYAGGVPLNIAIRVAGSASGSRLFARATEQVLRSMERGVTISQAFRETGVFPTMFLEMLHTGEQTGNVDAMMNKAAEYLEDEAETRAYQYAFIFSQALYLLVAFLVVGRSVINFWGGFYSVLGR